MNYLMITNIISRILTSSSFSIKNLRRKILDLFFIPTVSNRHELRTMLDDKGIPKRKFKIKAGISLKGLFFITSLKNVIIGKGCILRNLSNLTEVNGCIVGDYTELHGMKCLESMRGIKGGKRCIYKGLRKLNSLNKATIGVDSSLLGLLSLFHIDKFKIKEGVGLYHTDNLYIEPILSKKEVAIILELNKKSLNKIDEFLGGFTKILNKGIPKKSYFKYKGLKGSIQVPVNSLVKRNMYLNDLLEISTSPDSIRKVSKILPSMQPYLHSPLEEIKIFFNKVVKESKNKTKK